MGVRRSVFTVLDVGQGNSTVIEAGRTVAIIDTGNGGSLLAYLHQRDIRQIDHLILSHHDNDHTGAALALLADYSRFRVRHLYYNAEQSRTSDTYATLVRVAEEAELRTGMRLDSLVRGKRVSFAGVTLRILHPSQGRVARGGGKRFANRHSMVVRVELENTERALALLPGDCDWVGLRQLRQYCARRHIDPSARILVFPHHGSGSCAGDNVSRYVDEWIALTHAEVVLFSFARSPSDREMFPAREVLTRSSAQGCAVLCTQLANSCQAEAPSRQPQHVRGNHQRPQHQLPCAGTMVFDLRSGVLIQPAIESHSAYVHLMAKPACLTNEDTGRPARWKALNQ